MEKSVFQMSVGNELQQQENEAGNLTAFTASLFNRTDMLSVVEICLRQRQ
jgi:hypothetical protein